VALLCIDDAGRPWVSHIDLAHPERVYQPEVDWTAGFGANLARFTASILAPDLAQGIESINPLLFAQPDSALKAAWLRAAHRCWAGEQAQMSGADFLAEVKSEVKITAADLERVEAVLWS